MNIVSIRQIENDDRSLPQLDNYTIISFKLFLNSVKCEVILA
jgi:hypothetical protein